MNLATIREYGEKLQKSHFHTCKNTLSAGENTFCVEGALCKIMEIGEWRPWSVFRDLWYDYKRYKSAAPYIVWEKFFGVENPQAKVWDDFEAALAHVYGEDHPTTSTTLSLVLMNDALGLSVQKIGEYIVRAADYLESQELGEEVESFLHESKTELVADYAI